METWIRMYVSDFGMVRIELWAGLIIDKTKTVTVMNPRSSSIRIEGYDSPYSLV